MRWLILLLVLTATAHADPNGTIAIGAGSSIAETTAGWMVRYESRFMSRTHAHTDGVGGGRVGMEMWGAGDRWGLAMPVGVHFGAKVGAIRSLFAAGFGWTIERTSGDTHVGIAPYVGPTIELEQGRMVMSLEARVARQIVTTIDDYNVYSVIMTVGTRFGNK